MLILIVVKTSQKKSGGVLLELLKLFAPVILVGLVAHYCIKALPKLPKQEKQKPEVVYAPPWTPHKFPTRKEGK